MLRDLEEHLSRVLSPLRQSDSCRIHFSTHCSVEGMDAAQHYLEISVREVRRFCEQAGIRLDRVSIVTCYDADLNIGDDGIKSVSARDRSCVRVYDRPDGRTEAVLFVGGYVEGR